MDLVFLPGLTPYAVAWALQKHLHAQISKRERADVLLLLQHPHTLTMGRRGGWANLRATQEQLDAEGFERWQIDRGGDITYHGPGQLVGYPIVNLERANLLLGPFMRGIEQANIDLLAAYDIQAARQGEFPGVWCGDDLNQKITAVGVRVTAWTSTHGFALNVSTDLEAFGRILPCGLEGKTVTSMRAIMRARRGPDVSIDEVAGRLGPMVAAALGQPGDWIDPQDLPWPPPEAAEILRVQHLVRDALPQNERTESL